MNIGIEIDNSELFKQTFLQAFIGLSLTNEEGQFLEVNETICQLLGYTSDELKSLTIHDVTHPDDVADHLSFFSRLIKCEITNYQTEKRYINKTGNVIWVVTNISRVKDSNILIAQIKDITEQKQKEETYKEKEAHYHLMTEYSTDLIMRHDPSGKAFCISPSAKEILGYDPEELMGVSPYDDRFMHPDDLRQTITSHQQISYTGKITKVRYRIRKKKGVYTWLESTAKGIFNKTTNQLEEIITVSRDCTDHVMNDIKLKESEERYRTIVESSIDAIGIHDLEGNFVYANPSALKLFGETEVIGQHVYNFVTREGRDKFDQRMAEFDQMNKFTNRLVDYKVKRYDGSIREVEVMTDKIIYKGKPAVQFIARDITEQKKYEDFIHKADKLNVVGELAAGVAHEIRNPLTTIKGFIQLFQAKHSCYEQYFQLINSEFERVEAIIYEFLTLAKPHKEIIFKEENIFQILEEVVTLENANALLKNIEIDYKPVQETVLICCDKRSLKQVFINVLQNALEATSEKGKIEIAVEKKNNQLVEISFKDNGCGIPKHLIDRLGEPFYTLKEKGTGLGLMVSFKIIENHRGAVLINSEEGEGTTVTIQIPLCGDCPQISMGNV